ncbi:2TM domain-containing protein [Chryseobacterium sp. MYb264]|uniref:2TM domain-containing protein n=1 Tax=Chryseobacterium sp. MYb264 TaxID=2745153 RepID=UPI002E0E9EEC|nr:2TM domain-containing protein [Chryseobacterium sp. MYb264]
MEILQNNTMNYLEAQKQVKQIKGFYIHLIVYVCVNLFIIGLQAVDLDQNEKFWSWDLLELPALWGVGVAIHGMSIFLPTFLFGRNWESRKIKELMNEDQRNFKR